MKTIKVTTTLLAVMLIAACNTPYRTITTINRNGSIQKELYASADSAFMAGNLLHNPFLFPLDSGWNITRLDTAVSYNFFGKEKKLNVKISRNFSSFNAFMQNTQGNELMRPLAVPEELLIKRFRWFYTYYEYTGKFHEITDKGPVSIKRYLTESELRLLLQGDMSVYSGMNGIELNEVLTEASEKFGKWLARNCYEISFEIITNALDSLDSNHCILQLQNSKDTLFTIGIKKDADMEFTPANVCKLLDEYFKTTRFSALQQTRKRAFDDLYEEKTQVARLFEYVISYEVLMPGKLVQAGTPLRNNNALVWKIDAYRILASDYVLTAESRTVNGWAFALTGALLLVVIYCFMKVRRGKIP